MASLNLSSNGPSISRSYQSVVDAPAPTGPAASSPTYGQWAVFVVSTPLVNAFQQDSAGKESVLKVQSSGEGELVDLIDEFSDGRTQFAYVKVRDPNTGLPKNVLICWCGEGVPERTKGYFMNHQAAVSKLLHGYHVQITARSDRDLTPEGIIQKVADSSGSKYSSGTMPVPANQASKPPVASKPVFTPTRSGGAFKPLAGTRQPAAPASQNVDEDGWGEDAPPVTRTQLEKVKPAYQPTKVNMDELRSQKTPSTSYSGERSNDAPAGDVVKGGYQPVGKVDIAEIRRQAKESGNIKDDRPEPVKGSYEPVGKVDIAAIRARAQAPTDEPRSSPSNMSPAVTGGSAGSEGRSIADRSATFSSSDRLTSMPKPKVTNHFSGGGTFTGTKAPVPGGFDASAPPPAAQVGSASRTFADQGGKTPAQQWAERKARERGGAVETPSSVATPIQSQKSGGDRWKSSYAGKSWAPVQTGRPSAVAPQTTEEEQAEEEDHPSAGGVSGIRDRFANAAPMGAAAPASTYDRQAPSPPLDTSTKPSARGIPIPGLPSRTEEPKATEGEAHQEVPPPPQQPRSPTPESTPGSPIRVVMPVGRGADGANVTDAHEEQHSPPAALPIRSMQQNVPYEEELEEEPAHDPARAVAQAGVSEHEAAPPGGGIRALVQYDYEKAEDNEIELREGEFVTNIDMVDEDWWMGVNADGESGLFPRNYVEVVEDEAETAAPHQPPRPGVPETEPEGLSHAARDTSKDGLPTATALYDYEAAEDNEIGFPDGAKITNIEFPDEDWWHGEYNGRAGLFPANYVQLDE